MRRRDFLRLAAGAAGAGLLGAWPGAGARADDPDAPVHLLATASHDRLWLKASFAAPQARAPALLVDGRAARAQAMDTRGRFWGFGARGLRPGRRYTLELTRDGRALLDPWPFATLRGLKQRAERLRLLVYTCAGGDDYLQLYVPMDVRRRLLRRALDFAPDAAIAIGDHVYWDRVGGGLAFFTRLAARVFGFGDGFDEAAPVLGSANEDYLAFVGDRQIAALYGTLFRSLPVFFVRDDHDYFEDDREEFLVFPPSPFMRALARATQRLYYPEFLPDRARPGLPGARPKVHAGRLSEVFGTLRFGDLAELLLYDCKGFLTPPGVEGGQVPAAVERWLHERLARSPAEHVVQVPSNPIGWSAGKPAEWYPDVADGGALGLGRPKLGWQPGRLAQHDRLLGAAAARRRGVPLVVSGDIHSIAEQRILRSGALDLAHNPVVALLAGTPATGPRGFPSQVRGVVAAPPAAITAEPIVPVTERNGFHLIDFEPGAVTIHHFVWSPGDPIETLEPAFVSRHRA